MQHKDLNNNNQNQEGRDSSKEQKKSTTSSYSNTSSVSYPFMNEVPQGSETADSERLSDDDNDDSNNNYNNVSNATAHFGVSISPEVTSTIQLSNELQRYNLLRRYCTNILGGLEICVYDYDVQSEDLPGGGKQYFTIKNDEKILLFLPSDVKARKEIISKNKKQNTSSSTTDPQTAQVERLSDDNGHNNDHNNYNNIINAAAHLAFATAPEAASLESQTPNKNYKRTRRKFYLSLAGGTEIKVFPNEVYTEILPEGKKQLFTIVDGERINLYPPSDVKEYQLQNNIQDPSHIKRENYFTSHSCNGAVIRAFPNNVQREPLPEGKEQFFINEDGKKIYLYTFSQVMKEIMRPQNDEQNTSSSTSHGLTYEELEDCLFEDVPDQNSQHPNLSNPSAGLTYEELEDCLFNSSAGLTYKELEDCLFEDVPDQNSQHSDHSDPTRAGAYTTEGSNFIPSGSSDRNNNANRTHSPEGDRPSKKQKNSTNLSQVEEEVTSYLKRRNYFMNKSGSTIISVLCKNVRTERFFGGSKQRYIIENGERINLYTPGQVKSAQEKNPPQIQALGTPSFEPEKYFISPTGTAIIQVYPNNVRTEILPEGREQRYIIEDNKKIYLYLRPQIKEVQSIIRSTMRKFQSQKDGQNTSSSTTNSNNNNNNANSTQPNNYQDQQSSASQAYSNLVLFGTRQNNPNGDANENSDDLDNYFGNYNNG